MARRCYTCGRSIRLRARRLKSPVPSRTYRGSLIWPNSNTHCISMRYGCWSMKQWYHSMPTKRFLRCACGSIIKDETMLIDTRPYTPAIRPSASSPTTQQDALIETFQLEHQRYGLALEVVREIVRLPALIMLAGAPPALCGLLNLRGQHLPVLDGRVLVGECSQYDLSSQIVIAGRAQPELGILVDQVNEVCAVAADH